MATTTSTTQTPMGSTHTNQTRVQNKPIYWVIGAVVLAALIALFAMNRQTETATVAPAATTSPTTGQPSTEPMPVQENMNMGTATETNMRETQSETTNTNTETVPSTGEPVSPTETNDANVPAPTE